MTRADRPLTRISRRGLIGTGAAASLLAATGAVAAQPRPGGTLRIAVPDGWMFERMLAPGTAFDCLTEIDADGTLRGEIAGAWEARDGGRIWVVTVREDAAFHDGRPVTAADVVASLLPHRNGVLGGVRKMRAVGPRQVRFVLRGEDAQFPLRLASPELVIRPGGEPGGTVGSGLYRVAETGPGRAKLSRLADHPRSARGGWFERVEILGIEPADARLFALTAGRVDAAFGLAPSAGRLIARNRRLGTQTVAVAGPGGTESLLAGHSLRLHGLEGRDPLRLAERGFFA